MLRRLAPMPHCFSPPAHRFAQFCRLALIAFLGCIRPCQFVCFAFERTGEHQKNDSIPYVTSSVVEFQGRRAVKYLALERTWFRKWILAVRFVCVERRGRNAEHVMNPRRKATNVDMCKLQVWIFWGDIHI